MAGLKIQMFHLWLENDHFTLREMSPNSHLIVSTRSDVESHNALRVSHEFHLSDRHAIFAKINEFGFKDQHDVAMAIGMSC